MEQQQIKTNVVNILNNSLIGPMATVKNKKPYNRYMTFFHKDLKLFTATNKETDKIDEIKANPYTHILLGYEGDGFGDEFVEYEGKVLINDSPELKERLWDKHMEMWFTGPQDPNYIILEIEPTRIYLMNKKGVEPKVLEIDS